MRGFVRAAASRIVAGRADYNRSNRISNRPVQGRPGGPGGTVDPAFSGAANRLTWAGQDKALIEHLSPRTFPVMRQLFIGAMFVNAALLFAVQPMFARV